MSSSAAVKLVFREDIRRILVKSGSSFEELRQFIRDAFKVNSFVIEFANNEGTRAINNQEQLELALRPVRQGIMPNLRLVVKEVPISTYSFEEFASSMKTRSSNAASVAASSMENFVSAASTSFETLPSKLEGIASTASTSFGGFATSASASFEEASKNLASSYQAFSIWFQQILQQVKNASEIEQQKIAQNLAPHIEHVSNVTHNAVENIAPTVENVQKWFCDKASELKDQITTRFQPSPYEDKLKILEEMGFGDRLLNQYLLESNEGDLEACIQQFIQ